MNFGEIQQEIIQHLPQTRGAAASVQSWINRAMQRAEQRLAWPHMLTNATDTTTADQLEQDVNNCRSVEAVAINNTPLQFVPLEAHLKLDPSVSAVASPIFYTWRRKAAGTNVCSIRWWPKVTTGKALDYWYYGFTAELSLTGDTNWWTNYAPDVLIYGGIIAGATFIKELDRLNAFQERYNEALAVAAQLSGMTVPLASDKGSLMAEAREGTLVNG